jgi:hypothetical protein
MIDSETRLRGDLKIKFELVDDDYTGVLDNTDLFGRVQLGRTEDALSRAREHTLSYREEKWYVPAQSMESLVKYYQEQGDSKGSAYARASEARRQELNEFEDRYSGENYYSAGLVVKVYYKGKLWGDDSLWGLDMNVYSSNNEDYVRETALDVLSMAVDSALKNALKHMDADAVARFDSLNKAVEKLLKRRYQENRRQEYIRKVTAWRKGMIDWRYKSLITGENFDRSRASA